MALVEVAKQMRIQFEELSKEVHLPLLDHQVLDKYVFTPLERSATNLEARECKECLGDGFPPECNDREGNWELSHQEVFTDLFEELSGNARRVVRGLTAHKQRTLAVLEAVVQWEKVLAELMKLEGDVDYAATCTANAQVLAHHLLFKLQRASVAVVEKVERWRGEGEGAGREMRMMLPHPFIFRQENYLLKMLIEIDNLMHRSRIGDQLCPAIMNDKFPLFSNAPSLSLFKDDPAGGQTPKQLAKQWVRIRTGSAGDEAFQRRVVAAERVLLAELSKQISLVKFLMRRCAQCMFVPVLDLSALCPSLVKGGARGGEVAAASADHRRKRRQQQQQQQQLSSALPMPPRRGHTAASSRQQKGPTEEEEPGVPAQYAHIGGIRVTAASLLSSLAESLQYSLQLLEEPQSLLFTDEKEGEEGEEEEEEEPMQARSADNPGEEGGEEGEQQQRCQLPPKAASV